MTWKKVVMETARSPRDEPVPSSTTSKSEDPKQLSATRSSSCNNANTVNNEAKSCTGCLYYSAHSPNPLCLGLARTRTHTRTRSLPNVSKEEKSLKNFEYVCFGYSHYVDQRGYHSKGHETQTKLPDCVVGIRYLVNQIARVDSAASASPPIPNKEAVSQTEPTDVKALPQSRPPRPTNTIGDEFLNRFTRNAGLVANGAVKNMRRIGNQIKQGVDDALYLYKKRSK